MEIKTRLLRRLCRVASEEFCSAAEVAMSGFSAAAGFAPGALRPNTLSQAMDAPSLNHAPIGAFQRRFFAESVSFQLTGESKVQIVALFEEVLVLAAQLGAERFAVVEGNAVDMREADAIRRERHDREDQEDHNGQRGPVEVPRDCKYDRSDANQQGLHDQRYCHGYARLPFLPHSAEFQAPRIADGKNIAEGEVRQGSVEQSGKRRSHDYQRRGRENQADGSQSQKGFKDANHTHEYIFANQNVAKTHGRQNQKLNSRTFKREGVEYPVHLEQQNVCGDNREDHLRQTLEKIRAVMSVIVRGHYQHGDKKNGNGEVQEHDRVAKHVADLFFDNGGGGVR